MVKLLVASNNAKKRKELEKILADAGIAGIELLPLSAVEAYPEPVEDGRTFADNALIKARAGALATGLPCLADDSGLAVDALNGMPGVLSARWSGRHGDDAANNILAYIRWGVDATPVLAVVNLSGASQPNYRLGLPEAGEWEMLINTDDAVYGGAGNDLPRLLHTEPTEWDRFEQSVELHVPAMSAQWYILRR